MSNGTAVEAGGRQLAARLRKLAAWEEALNSDPMERLERRVAALEHELLDLRRSLALKSASSG
jgi:hypothetical protein